MLNRRCFCLLPFALYAGHLTADTATSRSTSTAITHDAGLPELGNPDEHHLPPQEQARLGQLYYRRLLAHPDYLDDPEWHSYLQAMGRRLGGARGAAQAVEINLLGNRVINASALPGGYITLHAGLILACEQADELAAVVAHEIAHIHQHHMARMIAKLKGEQIKTAVALLAAVVVGGTAGISGGSLASANLISQQLAYTRDFEREADALGIHYLADAGYAPQAMSAFLTKLERDSRTRATQQRDFLRTHPLFEQRIANAESRARQYPPHQSEPNPDSTALHPAIFPLLQTKLQVHITDRADLERLDADFAERAAHGGPQARLAAGYGRAKIAIRQHRPAAAIPPLMRLAAEYPALPALSLALAEAELPDNPAAAARRLGELSQRHPQADYLLPYHAAALLAAKDAAAARALLRRRLRRAPESLALYRLLSQAEAALANLGAAHQADAEYHFRLGDYPAARDALQRAMRDAPNDRRIQQSAKARLSEIEALDE